LIISVQGMSTGAVEFMESEFASLGSDIIIVSPDQNKIEESFIEDIKALSEVVEVIPFIQNNVMMSSLARDKGCLIMGVDINKFSTIFPSLQLLDGEFYDNGDQYNIVLGHDVAEPNKEDPFASIDETVKLTYQSISPDGRLQAGKKSFSVRGITDEAGNVGFLPLDDIAFISLRAAERIFEKEDYDGLYVLTSEEDGSLNRVVENYIEDTLSLSAFSAKNIIEVIDTVMTSMKGFVDNIAIVALGVAAVGIITTLYTSALERTKEIGTLKALGYTKRQILALFLNEAMIIGVIGGTLGVFAGFGIAILLGELIAYFAGDYYVSPVYHLDNIVIVWAMSIILSTLAGLYPAKKAADLDPVVALRKE
jgi:putative ABC transport system permease protein